MKSGKSHGRTAISAPYSRYSRSSFFYLGLLMVMFCLPGAARAGQQAEIRIGDYGAAGDGSTDDGRAFRRALEEIGEGEGRIVISGGEFRIDGIRFPEKVTLVFRGGRLRVPEGGSVRIDGAIEAAIVPIFSGKGRVEGRIDNLYVFPQWFGARGDGVHDDASALQRAADLAAESLGNTLFLPQGEYLFGDDLVIRTNLESRGLLVKRIEIDEERTEFSHFTFLPTHHPKKDPQVTFAPDHEEVELLVEPFYGVEEGQVTLPVYREVATAAGGSVDLAEGGTIRFYSSDFFSSRNNHKGDQFYDRNDISRIVSGRGDVFPEFAFSYAEPPSARAWSESEVYAKGDYVSHAGELFKATWPSGPGSLYRDRFLGTVPIGPVRPRPGEATTRHEFVYDDGSEDDIMIWRRVETRVWYREEDRRLTVNGLRVQVRLEGHAGRSKRISAGAVNVHRSNMTFNDLQITVRDREAGLSRLLNSRQAVNLEFNNGYFSGATFHGLGYNILNSNVADVRYNHCVSTNSRKGLDGRHGKNVTINGGYFNVIDDHYGRNYFIRDVVVSGRSTAVPGYATPDADLQAWHFRTIRAFAFSGAHLHIENVVVHEGSGGILSVRGDIGDFYGRIVLRNVSVRGNRGDVTLFNHSVNPEFDFAGEVRTPERMVVEEVALENPGRLNLTVGRGLEGGYGPVVVRGAGPIGRVYASGASLTFSDCTVEDGEFEAADGARVHFQGCTFFGRSVGLGPDGVGATFGNVRAKGAEVDFPVDFVNDNRWEE